MKLNIMFDGKTMCTPVYIKKDAQEQVLLSEVVCRQLRIIHYHEEVRSQVKRKKEQSAPEMGPKEQDDDAVIPSIQVDLI